MWEKIKSILKSLKIGLALGMKTADEQIMHIDNVADDKDTGIHKQQDDHRVAKHLLKGEVTQEVKDLVHRTIVVDRESKGYTVYTPYKALKDHEKRETKTPKIYNKERYKLLTVQENKNLGDNLYEVLNNIDSDNITLDDRGEIRQEIGKIKKSHNYLLKLKRSLTFTPRYLIEEYTKKLVCFIVNEEKNQYALDFYVTKYPNDKDWKSKGFVREVEYIKNELRRSDITNVKSLEFATEHAYGFYDGIVFKFDNLVFKSVLEYDGDYILRFKASISENAKDFFEDLYSKNMAKKYENKQKKEVNICYDPYSYANVKTYTCSMCGKTITYNLQDIDSKEASEEPDTKQNDTTEFLDMENTEQMFGKKICKDCMNKYKTEILSEYNQKVEKINK